MTCVDAGRWIESPGDVRRERRDLGVFFDDLFHESPLLMYPVFRGVLELPLFNGP